MKVFKRKTQALHLFLLLGAATGYTSCSSEDVTNDTLESVDEIVLNEELLSAATTCGNRHARGLQANISGSSAWAQRGDAKICNNHEVKLNSKTGKYSADRSTANQGTIDCRTRGAGGYTETTATGTYHIVQAHKTSNVTTGTRIERAFKNFSRPGSGGKTVTFKGKVEVDKLDMATGEYTYIAQMHGSGKVVSGGSKRNEKHNTAIWLLRVEKNAGSKFEFVIESSTKPKTAESGGNPTRKRTRILQGDIGTFYEIEMKMGYASNREPFAEFRIRKDGTSAWTEKDMPTIGFATEQQYFRYGAYRVGPPTSSTSKPSNPDEAIIKWRSENYCQQ